MKRISVVLAATALVLFLASPAAGQTVVGTAAENLRRDPVYVAPERQNDVSADSLRSRIRASDAPIFVAVLPASAVDEAGGDPGGLPAALAQEVGLRGTYAVVAGNRFRAGSTALPRGRAGALATASFQASSSQGPEAVLATFIDRVNEQQAGGQSSPAGDNPNSRDRGSDGDGGSGTMVLIVLAVLAGGAFLLWRGKRRRREAEAARREQAADRQLLAAELSVLGDDVIALDPQVTLHPEAQADYEAGVTRFKAGQAALEYADDEVDLERVDRVVKEGRYAMNRARARVEGREPPPPPADLTRPGRRDEPALDLDERGEPMYVGFGAPFYGGGWFAGTGGLLSGLMLGSMLGGPWGMGGWGWGGGWGGGGDGGSNGGEAGAEVGGGDWGGDFGGDFGGGDFGGGDIGGGDF